MFFGKLFAAFISLFAATIFFSFNKLIANASFRPSSVGHDVYLNWKWRNIFVSFTHSVVTAVAGLIIIYLDPTIAINMATSHSRSAYTVLCFTNGYFIYDISISVANIRYPGRYEMIMHHIITITCLCVTIYEKLFIGYCATAFIVEISNIFLHIRQMLPIYGILSKTTVYKVNSVLTLISLITCRLSPLFWITICLYRDQYLMPEWYYILSTSAAVGIIFFSFAIIYRVIKSDFIKPKIR